MGLVMDSKGLSLSLDESPCIGVCTTARGDPICKGCGRSLVEVRDWNTYPSVYKKLVVLRAAEKGYTPRQVFSHEGHIIKNRHYGGVCTFRPGKHKHLSAV